MKNGSYNTWIYTPKVLQNVWIKYISEKCLLLLMHLQLKHTMYIKLFALNISIVFPG